MFTLLAVGDVGPHREDPAEAFDLVRPTLTRAEICLGQQEICISARGKHSARALPSYGARSRTHPGTAKAIAEAGFNVMSFASNHALNFGEEAFEDTIAHLRKNQVQVIGAGRDITEARRPAIFTHEATRVGILAYCSVVPPGDEATDDRCGLAPMRAFAHFVEDTPWQPGRQPKILTFPRADDLEAMTRDITKLRSEVDVVVVSIHWGTTGVEPAHIVGYQFAVGRAAVDAGADVVVGHHAHIIKGVEVYRGKPIFYCVGNFQMDETADQLRNTLTFKLRPFDFDPDYPTYPYPADYRKAMIVKCAIDHKRVARVSFVPVMINKKGQPEPLSASDPRSDEVVRYAEWACRDQGLETRFVRRGDEIEVVT